MADISSIEILKFDPGAGWPFSEEEYDRKARKKIVAPESANELVSILRTSSPNVQNRNHPQTPYYGILRIDLAKGGHYYVFYELGYYEGNYYTTLRANSKNETNPNEAEQFENKPLADFLKRNDSWYHSADVPVPDGRRVNSPDNVW
ncbi:MAG TPA: hypothetical protein VHD56_19675 [Tepidisphaeraceae bacterium]|nr:hypothetical protein [Tepidisphaeraceae bacterium]